MAESSGDTALGASEDTAVGASNGTVETTSAGQSVWHCTAEQYLPLIHSLYDSGYRFCVDVCATDALTNQHRQLPPEIPAQRFEVVVNLLDMAQRRRTRVRAQVPAQPAPAQPAPAQPAPAQPEIATITHLYPGAEAPEREAADLFGIRFVGHPDPSRILMPEDWQGHPLRKDYNIGAIPVQFKEVSGR